MLKKTVITLFCSLLCCLTATAADYKGPSGLIPAKDGSVLWILNQDAQEIAVMNLADNTITQSIAIPERPNGFCLSVDEKTAYVACGSYQGSLYLINLADGKVISSMKTGHTPCGPVLHPDGTKIYLCLRFDNKIVEIDLASMKELRRFNALHDPINAVITPDGKSLFVANFLPHDPADAANVAAEITCVDIASGDSKNIRLPNGSSSMHGIFITPDGKYVCTTAILARYQMPTTQLERGWMNTNGFSIIDAEKREFINTVLLDDVESGAANPWPIASSLDGSKIYVGLAGTHELCIVDTKAMIEKLLALPKTIEEAKAAGTYSDRNYSSVVVADQVPNDLAFLVGLKKRVKLKGKSPRSLAVVGDKVYAGMYFSDSLSVVSFSKSGIAKVKEVPIGPKPEMTPERRGHLAWTDATLCFQTWQSCESCHPEARMDALNWDLLNDGMGNPKNAKSMLFSMQQPPAMWHGVRPTANIAIRTGFQYIQFSKPKEDVCVDIEKYLESLRPVMSPYLVNGELSETAKRGKALFESERIGCANCHIGEYFSDGLKHDVGSAADYDSMSDFVTPMLTEVWRTSPYMHDGRYVDMKDVFKEGMHGDVKGDILGMTDEEIDDLVEYVLSL